MKSLLVVGWFRAKVLRVAFDAAGYHPRWEPPGTRQLWC